MIELKKIMVERGVGTIKELSELTGVNRNTISGVVKGKIQPSAEVMLRIIDALGIPASQAGEFFSPSICVTCKFEKEMAQRR